MLLWKEIGLEGLQNKLMDGYYDDVEKNVSPMRRAVYRCIASFLLICLIVGLGLTVTERIANLEKEGYLDVRKAQVATAAAAIEYSDVQSLKGDESDFVSPVYEKLRSKLVRIRQSDKSIRFVYLMRPKGNKLIFLVDAEEPSSPDFSPPGQVYKETSREDIEVFQNEKWPQPSIEEGEKDRWGTWLSSTAYINDPEGKPVAFLGTDVDFTDALAGVGRIKYIGRLLTSLAALLFLILAVQHITWSYGRAKREALRREMEAKIIELNEELIRADRMKSDFLELASHELRSPVSAIDIAIQTLDKSLDGRANEDERMLLDIAKSGSRRLVSLVDDILDLTRVEAGDFKLSPREIDVKKTVSEVVKIFEPMAKEKGLAISLTFEGDDQGAIVDEHALLRGLENLVSNALKYTDTGFVDVSVKVDDEHLRIAVKDTGIGVPSHAVKDLFKKFSRVHEMRASEIKGTGLGLSLCKALVEAQGGRIWYEENPTGGSIFAFEIPRYAATVGLGDEKQLSGGKQN